MSWVRKCLLDVVYVSVLSVLFCLCCSSEVMLYVLYIVVVELVMVCVGFMLMKVLLSESL